MGERKRCGYKVTNKEVMYKTDDNYRRLVSHLRSEDLHIGRNHFKAVLHAMNGRTLYNRTKLEAIRAASRKYGVTQVSVKKIIDEMHFQSKRAMENKEAVKRALTAANLLKRKLDQEEAYKE